MVAEETRVLVLVQVSGGRCRRRRWRMNVGIEPGATTAVAVVAVQRRGHVEAMMVSGRDGDGSGDLCNLLVIGPTGGGTRGLLVGLGGPFLGDGNMSPQSFRINEIAMLIVVLKNSSKLNVE